MARTVLLCVAALLSGAVASNAAGSHPDLVGMYECSGVNPDGTQYKAVVQIARIEDTYRVLWTLSDDSHVLGVGIFSGGVLAVSYYGGAPAVVVYQIEAERLVGEWTIGGREGAVYAETLIKVASLPPARAPVSTLPATRS